MTNSYLPMRSAERIVGLTRSKTNGLTKEQKMAKKTRKQKIQNFLKTKPNASINQIMEATGCVSSYAHIVRKEWLRTISDQEFLDLIEQQTTKSDAIVKDIQAMEVDATVEAHIAEEIDKKHDAQHPSKQFAQEFSRQTTLLGLKFVRMYVDDEIKNLEAKL